jgi:ethanolamine ammonia-lyase small subunit
MSNDLYGPVQPDPWQELRACTPARIALGRTGSSLPTTEILRFGLAHARARDAVHRALDAAALCRELEYEGFHLVRVRSQVPERQTYLLRPDLGRRLHPDSRAQLEPLAGAFELAIVIADGLSSIAVQRHALPLLALFRSDYPAEWERAPVVVAEQGRVALGDDIGEALRARLAIVMIGERPGLSSPDSLGIYITFDPRIGRMDSERNCISNVRPEGLPYAAAARGLRFLVSEALRRSLTGVQLKNDSDLHEAGLLR